MQIRLELVGTGKDFLNRTLIAQALRPTVNKWDLMKLESFCMAKGTVSLDKAADYRMIKDLYQLSI